MRRQLKSLLTGKNSLVNLLLILAVCLGVGLACRGSRDADAKPIPPAYLGDWEGQDGATLSIRADGKGDYRAGSTKVEGGTAEVDEAAKTVSVTFFGIGKTLKIDQPPAGNQMKLDGVVFRRKGGFAVEDSGFENNQNTADSKVDKSTPANASKDAPPVEEVENLVKDSLADFAGAVDAEDFNNFRANTSRDFQATYSADLLKTTFSVFIDKKEAALPSLNDIANQSPSFTDGPRIRTERGAKILVATGSFPSKPYAVQFENEYQLEKGSWKLFKIKVKM